MMLDNLPSEIVITRVGCTFAPTATAEDLVFALNYFVSEHEESRWCIGDTINAIEDRFSKKYDVAVHSTRYERSTLWNLASVCRRVATSRRREVLLFSHHEAVASLTPAKQVKYLALAASKTPRMTVAELRQMVRDNESTCDNGDEQCAVKRDSVMDHVYSLTAWSKQQNPADWPKRRRDAVKEEMRPIVDFYNRL